MLIEITYLDIGTVRCSNDNFFHIEIQCLILKGIVSFQVTICGGHFEFCWVIVIMTD